MIVLDTNVVSEMMRNDPEVAVTRWVDAQETGGVHLTAITVAELVYGIARLPEGKRKAELARQVATMVDVGFRRRILAFDEAAAAQYGDLVAERERSGRPIGMADAQIAAICRCHGAVLATRDVDGFVGVGVDLIDPWAPPE